MAGNRTTAQRAKAQLVGQRARAAGLHFENMISASCAYYADRGLAKIEKTPEPMKPLGQKNAKGQFVACLIKQAQPDYGGTIKGGRSIYFEAKHTDDDHIEQRRLTKEQADDLEAHHRLGAIAFVLVSFGLRDFYRIPWPIWRDMAELYGRKYVKETELRGYAVPAVAGYIKILDGIVGLNGYSAKVVIADEMDSAGTAAESEPGKWIPRNDEWFDFFQCSICGAKQKEKTDRCPNCKHQMEVTS